MKGKKKASGTTYDSEEPTEQEMSVSYMCHGCLFRTAILSFELPVAVVLTYTPATIQLMLCG